MVKRISAGITSTIVMLLITLFCTAHAEANATIKLAPSTTTVAVGTTLTLDVTVADVIDLAAWEFRLFYLNTILNFTNIVEGSFLKEGGSTFFVFGSNTTQGWLQAGSTLLGQMPGVNGTGTLATITFHAIAAGDTALQFSNDSMFTYLLDSSPPPRHSIPFTTIDGTVHITADHDVAITNVTSYKTIIGQETSGNITVASANLGELPETFNVTVYVNTTIVETRTVNNLTNGTYTVLNFSWNTTGFAKGNYTLSASVWLVPFETDTANNNFTSPVTVMVGIPGDVVSPFGVEDMKDVAYVAKRFGMTPAQSTPSLPWDSNVDFDNTGKVDMKDVAIVAKYFGKRDP